MSAARFQHAGFADAGGYVESSSARTPPRSLGSIQRLARPARLGMTRTRGNILDQLRMCQTKRSGGVGWDRDDMRCERYAAATCADFVQRPGHRHSMHGRLSPVSRFDAVLTDAGNRPVAQDVVMPKADDYRLCRAPAGCSMITTGTPHSAQVHLWMRVTGPFTRRGIIISENSQARKNPSRESAEMILWS